MAKEGLKQRLEEIGMKEHELTQYLSYRGEVQSEIDQLANIIQSLGTNNELAQWRHGEAVFTRARPEHRGSERTWLRNRTGGELDEGRLVDALTGDRCGRLRVLCLAGG